MASKAPQEQYLSGGSFVASTVGLVDVGDLGHERIVGVGVCQQRADG